MAESDRFDMEGIAMALRTFIIAVGISLAIGHQARAMPPGYEVLMITSTDDYVDRMALNNCGEFVYSRRVGGFEDMEEIFHFDNGVLTQITNNGMRDAFPHLNDNGTMVWTRNADGFGGGSVMVLRDGKVRELAEGVNPRVNNLEHIVWTDFLNEGCGAVDSVVRFWDGDDGMPLSPRGQSNQTPRINDADSVVWTRFDFCPGGQNWQSDIFMAAGGVAAPLTTDQLQATAPSINNVGQVAWSSKDPVTFGRRVELWQEGVTSIITDWGAGPVLNDRGDFGFTRWHDDLNLWQAWAYYDGEFMKIFDEDFYNFTYDINNWGELALAINPFPVTDVGYMRRIRTGEADFDGHIDLRDAAAFQNCMTGPGDFDGTTGGFDRLCDCRFLDIDHDRDVDADDHALFATAMTGPQ